MIAMTGSNSSRAKRRGRQGKVVRLIGEYDLEELGDDLVEAWTAEGDQRMSLRNLAERTNVRLLEAILQREMVATVNGEVENYVRLLTADDVSTGSRLEAEHRLTSAGIDVDQLRSNFVSRQAVHSYLTGERNISYEPTEADPQERLESRIESINRLRSRLSTVTEQSVRSLVDAEILDASEVRASVRVEVECTSCGDLSTIREFFEEEGCACDPKSA